MIHIYQIGKHRLHIHDPSLAHEMKYDSRQKSEEIFRSPYSVPMTGRWLYKSNSLRVAGTLVDIEDGPRAEQLAQILRSEIDMIQDVIAYEVTNAANAVCACETHDGDILWIHNLGIIRNVNVSRGDAFDPPEIDLDIEMVSFWEPLNELLWYFGSVSESSLDPVEAVPPYRDLLAVTPHAAQIFNSRGKEFFLWVKRNFASYDFLYDPLSWEMCSDHVHAKTWVPGGWYVFDIPEGDWGGPPHVIYAFTNLSSTGGTITVRTVKERGWNQDGETITIDLAQLDTDLAAAGYTGLQAADQIIIGDVSQLPGYIRRAGQLLTISPRVEGWGSSQDTYWPGAVNPGQNRIFLDPADGMVAYRITPRKL